MCACLEQSWTQARFPLSSAFQLSIQLVGCGAKKMMSSMRDTCVALPNFVVISATFKCVLPDTQHG